MSSGQRTRSMPVLIRGQRLIKEDIKKYNLNRVVVSACSVRMHEPTFRAAVAEAGLNPFLMEMANIREQCTWAHGHDREGALEKAKDLTAAAIAKVRFLTELEMIDVPVTRKRWSSGGAWPVSALRSTWRNKVSKRSWWKRNRQSVGSWPSSTRPSPPWTVVYEYSHQKWLTRRVSP